jgi:hypothetical protein
MNARKHLPDSAGTHEVGELIVGLSELCEETQTDKYDTHVR